MAISNARPLARYSTDAGGTSRMHCAGGNDERGPLTDEVQRWSYRYGLIFSALPIGGGGGEAVRAS